MEEQNDKSTLQLEFLGEYHDIVIDWNDDNYECKETQLFELLEPITGIPRQFYNEIHLRSDSRKETICDIIRIADGRFHLEYRAGFYHWRNHTQISYTLVPENLVPEGECCIHLCRHRNTKTFFNKLKDIINNDQLNAKIASLLTPHGEDDRREVILMREICKQFNVSQYFYSPCITRYMRLDFESEEVRVLFSGMRLYLRTRG
uniref:Uncharacterized protein n=1 Tax=Tetranychus urticae TaxID=32264 RepID=T1KLP1_TETUR